MSIDDGFCSDLRRHGVTTEDMRRVLTNQRCLTEVVKACKRTSWPPEKVRRPSRRWKLRPKDALGIPDEPNLYSVLNLFYDIFLPDEATASAACNVCGAGTGWQEVTAGLTKAQETVLVLLYELPTGTAPMNRNQIAKRLGATHDRITQLAAAGRSHIHQGLVARGFKSYPTSQQN